MGALFASEGATVDDAVCLRPSWLLQTQSQGQLIAYDDPHSEPGARTEGGPGEDPATVDRVPRGPCG